MTKKDKALKAVDDCEKNEGLFLTELEVERLEKARLVCELRDKELYCLNLQIDRLKDQKTILELSIKNLAITENTLINTANEVKSRKSQDQVARVTVLDAIRERLNISGEFGYNPDSFEVIQN